jgi:hypothetical protein
MNTLVRGLLAGSLVAGAFLVAEAKTFAAPPPPVRQRVRPGAEVPTVQEVRAKGLRPQSEEKLPVEPKALVCKSPGDFTKLFRPGDAATEALKRVDFDKQHLVVFLWRKHPSADQILHCEEGGQAVFEYERGPSNDRVPPLIHVKAFAVRAGVKWSFGPAPAGKRDRGADKPNSQPQPQAPPTVTRRFLHGRGP